MMRCSVASGYRTGVAGSDSRRSTERFAFFGGRLLLDDCQQMLPVLADMRLKKPVERHLDGRRCAVKQIGMPDEGREYVCCAGVQRLAHKDAHCWAAANVFDQFRLPGRHQVRWRRVFRRNLASQRQTQRRLSRTAVADDHQ
jgi:hypothetical protein